MNEKSEFAPRRRGENTTNAPFHLLSRGVILGHLSSPERELYSLKKIELALDVAYLTFSDP